MVRQGILHGMLKGEALADPFSAAAVAQSGATDNRLFQKVLDMMKADATQEGIIPFGLEAHDGDEIYATLWALSILVASDRVKDHHSYVEPALDWCEKHLDRVFEEPPRTVARLMAVALEVDPEGLKALARKCLDHLLACRREDGKWDGTERWLARDGEVVDCLIRAALVLGPDAGGAAEGLVRPSPTT